MKCWVVGFDTTWIDRTTPDTASFKYENTRQRQGRLNTSASSASASGSSSSSSSSSGDASDTVTITADSPYGPHRCFAHTTLRFLPLPSPGSSSGGQQRGEVVIHAAGPATPGCSDLFLLATAGHFRLERVAAPGGRVVVPWTPPADASEAEIWCVPFSFSFFKSCMYVRCVDDHTVRNTG